MNGGQILSMVNGVGKASKKAKLFSIQSAGCGKSTFLRHHFEGKSGIYRFNKYRRT